MLCTFLLFCFTATYMNIYSSIMKVMLPSRLHLLELKIIYIVQTNVLLWTLGIFGPLRWRELRSHPDCGNGVVEHAHSVVVFRMNTYILLIYHLSDESFPFTLEEKEFLTSKKTSLIHQKGKKIITYVKLQK